MIRGLDWLEKMPRDRGHRVGDVTQDVEAHGLGNGEHLGVLGARHGGTIVADGPSSASQTAMGGHCSVNGTPTRKPSAQPLPPEIERRDRDR